MSGSLLTARTTGPRAAVSTSFGGGYSTFVFENSLAPGDFARHVRADLHSGKLPSTVQPIME